MHSRPARRARGEAAGGAAAGAIAEVGRTTAVVVAGTCNTNAVVHDARAGRQISGTFMNNSVDSSTTNHTHTGCRTAVSQTESEFHAVRDRLQGRRGNVLLYASMVHSRSQDEAAPSIVDIIRSIIYHTYVHFAIHLLCLKKQYPSAPTQGAQGGIHTSFATSLCERAIGHPKIIVDGQISCAKSTLDSRDRTAGKRTHCGTSQHRHLFLWPCCPLRSLWFFLHDETE